jgi:site-specific DNA-methyltransferase (adenine-specific)
MVQLLRGDCLELMKQIPDKSIDAVITDPPYGSTCCAWDSVVPLAPMWEQLKRIIKPNGAIVLFGSQPFTSALIMSNPKMFKYEWVWEKSKGCNFTHAKNMPIKFTESLIVFSKAPIGHNMQLGEKRMRYNPQGIIKVDKKWSRPRKYENGHGLKRDSHKLERIIEFENYPTNILRVGNSDNRERGLHPTQKPVALMEYLIKTYTNEGETVLDFTAGSGTLGVAAINTNRNAILIERDAEYFKIIEKRISEAEQSKKNNLFAGE